MTAHLRLVEPTEVVDPVEVLMAIDDEIDSLQIRRQIPLSVLWETIGKPMLEKGQQTKRLDGFIYHVQPPRERLYCGCHASLVYQCPNGPTGLGEPFTRMDSRPSFYVSRIKTNE